jgi:hypothetical protein
LKHLRGIQSASQPTTKSEDTIRKAQFGDGYEQVSGSGLNDEKLIFEFSFRGRPEKGLEIYLSSPPQNQIVHLHTAIRKRPVASSGQFSTEGCSWQQTAFCFSNV